MTIGGVAIADVVIGAILLAGVVRGFQRGLLREVMSLAGFAIGLLLANQNHDRVAPVLSNALGSLFAPLKAPELVQPLSFVLIVVGILIVANVVGEVMHRLIGFLLPGTFNRLAGVVFGLAESALSLEVMLLLFAAVSPALLGTLLADSKLGDALLSYGPLLFAMLPKGVLPVQFLSGASL